ncbi:MAG: hypothetical protein H6634_09310 [Anaerolineales bacterium]|nr:hypothetical protein [Anaerolineales bacterium]
MKIERPDGVTPSEKYLKRLCDRAFLSLWSYSGIFRDQKHGGKGDGKELCDLLVVFENHVVIFSDKYIEFPKSGNIQIDWSRWYRHAIKDSAKQIYGAERWIKLYPNRLFLDRKCTQRLPVTLPNVSNTIFHRVVIAHGIANECKNFFQGGSGSLLLSNRLVGDAHFQENPNPFVVGQVDPKKGFVHIFDDTTLDIILNKLDTVTDFVDYLSKKERFFANNRFEVVASGEEDLLAYFFRKLGKDGKHDFVLPSENLSLISLEGLWEDFIQSPQYRSQQDADKISFSWDALIEKFNRSILSGNQYYKNPSDIEFQEKTIRFLARESRTKRRLLSKALLGLLDKTPEKEFALRVVGPIEEGDPYYVFMLFPRYEDLGTEEYRKLRLDVLYSYCLVTRLKFKDAMDIVGFATESGNKIQFRSEDLIYYDGRNWTDEDQKNAEYFSNEHDLLKEVNEFRAKEYEFPIRNSRKRRRRK